MRIEISVKLRSNGYLNKTKNRSRTTSRTVIYGDEGFYSLYFKVFLGFSNSEN